MLDLPIRTSEYQSKNVKNSTDNGTAEIINNEIVTAKNSIPLSAAKTLFYYHTGSVGGLAVASKNMCVTVGDDKQLMLWDATTCVLVSKTTLEVQYLQLKQYYLLFEW